MKKTTLRHRGKVVFEKVEMEYTFNRFPKLFQEEEACFMFINQGGFYFRTPTKLIEIREREAVVAKCGSYFIEPSPNLKAENSIIVFGAYFYPNMIKEFFQTDLRLVEFKHNFDVSTAKVEPLMILFIESINHLLENPEIADGNLIASKLKELILLLGKTESSIHDFINKLFTPYEHDFKEVIQQNTFVNLPLADLASLCGCSLATFKRRFKKYYNNSPAKYLLLRKLEKSIQLLSMEDISIAEVAFECGFNNINHFNKAFKKQYGLSPSQSRMNQKGEHLSF